MTSPLKSQVPSGENRLETAADHPGPAIECPHCGRVVSIRTAVATRQSFLSKKRKIWLAVGVACLMCLVVLAYLWRRFIFSGLDLVAEATGNRTTAFIAVVFTLFAFISVLLWMLLPLFVCLGLRKLSHRMDQLDRTVFLCSGETDRLTMDREASARPLIESQAPAVEPSGPNAETHQKKDL